MEVIDEVEKDQQDDVQISNGDDEVDEVVEHMPVDKEVQTGNFSNETYKSYKDNNSKILYYTGLPNWEIFKVVYDFVCPDLFQRSSLTTFQQLLLTLMRLRHNFSLQDLGYRFMVHSSTVSRVFHRVINVLFIKLKPLILWPERDILLATMPMCFRKHCPRCTVIIDCFEIFIERPSNQLAKAQTFSTYKHHNTVKYLIGVTLQGAISFVSEGWGGSVSDKHVTENCGLLNNLIPGDVILADRGFDISESVAAWAVTVTIPAFTKGKKQLSGIDVEQTRCIANVRIHVERVIGLLHQKYTILTETQPIDYVQSKNGNKPMLDKFVTVACAWTNLCDSVINTDQISHSLIV